MSSSARESRAPGWASAGVPGYGDMADYSITCGLDDGERQDGDRLRLTHQPIMNYSKAIVSLEFKFCEVPRSVS
jgi:hypothetical protein